MPHPDPDKTQQKEQRQSERKMGREKRAQARDTRAESREKRNVASALPPVTPVAQPATLKKRHYGLLLSFCLLVLLPVALIFWYLNERAADQYASTLGFSVRSEEAASPYELLGGVAGLGASGSSDTDILYEFIQSQQLVEAIDDTLDLYALFSKPDNDPVFSFNPDQPIEDLVTYWPSRVKIYYDASTGLIEVKVFAFSAADAQAISRAIFDQSSLMINGLNDAAREDATRYAREELDRAIERLKLARQAMTAFRNETQIVDPTADLQGQMGVVNTLQVQLAESMIQLDLLRDTTQANDPRLGLGTRKIEVIEARIAEERAKLGLSGDGDAYASLIGQFEALNVDREFAESAYIAALSTFDAAVADAGHQSRYLAAYIQPTLAQSSQYPDVPVLTGLGALFAFLIWVVAILVFYAVRDRR